MARLYARVTGVVLLLLGILGLFTSPDLLTLNSELIEDLIHLVSGAAALYVGFGARDDGPAIMYARIFGAVYLLVGILGFVDDRMFGLFPRDNPLEVQDHIVHLGLGIIGLAAGFVTGDRRVS